MYFTVRTVLTLYCFLGSVKVEDEDDAAGDGDDVDGEI